MIRISKGSVGGSLVRAVFYHPLFVGQLPPGTFDHYQRYVVGQIFFDC